MPNVHRGSTEFVEALATELAPALQAVAYEDAIANKTLVARLIAYGSRKGRLLIGRPAPSRPKTRRARGPGTEQALWERVLFRSDHAEWRSLISPEFVWESIDGMHPGETHWSVATVQLFVESGL